MIAEKKHYEFVDSSSLKLTGADYNEYPSVTRERSAWLNEMVRGAENGGGIILGIPSASYPSIGNKDDAPRIMSSRGFDVEMYERAKRVYETPYYECDSPTIGGRWKNLDRLGIVHGDLWREGFVSESMFMSSVDSVKVVPYVEKDKLLTMRSVGNMKWTCDTTNVLTKGMARSSHGVINGFDALGYGGTWNRNLVAACEPEDADQIADAGIVPFLGINLSSSSITRKANFYYRIVWSGMDYAGKSKSVDYTYSKEYYDSKISMGKPKWIYSNGVVDRSYPQSYKINCLFAVHHCALWNGKAPGSEVYSLLCDNTSNTVFVYATPGTSSGLFQPALFIRSQNGKEISTIFDGMTSKSAGDAICKSAGVEKLPSTRNYMNYSGFNKVGYMVYVEPCWYLTKAVPAPRDIGK